MGIIMGANNLMEVFKEKYYRDLNGGILEAFGILFSRDLRSIYTHGWRMNELLTIDNAPIHPRLKPLFEYLVFNRRMVDIEDYDRNILNIYSKNCLQLIKEGQGGWEHMVPTYVDTIIKDKELFGYNKNGDQRKV